MILVFLLWKINRNIFKSLCLIRYYSYLCVVFKQFNQLEISLIS